jgi:hypothetical protein
LGLSLFGLNFFEGSFDGFDELAKNSQEEKNSQQETGGEEFAAREQQERGEEFAAREQAS